MERSAVRISRKDQAQQPNRILQISPLRFAPVEMTKGREVYFLNGDYWEQGASTVPEFFRSLFSRDHSKTFTSGLKPAPFKEQSFSATLAVPYKLRK